MKICSLLKSAVLVGKWAQGPSVSSLGNVLIKTLQSQITSALEQGR